MLAQRLRQTFTLPSGRVVGFAEYGSRLGRRILYLHGTPSSRLETGMWDQACSRLGIRLVVPDRPGMGLSTFHPNRTILDYPSDIAALAEHLEWPTFSILGGSGGVPYVLACAHALPVSRLERIGVVAGSGPPAAGTTGVPLSGRLAAKFIWPYPRLMEWLLNKSEIAYAHDPDPKVYEGYVRKQLGRLSPSDKAACERDLTWLVSSGRESVSQGSRGPAWDVYLMSQAWGFDIGHIKHSGVQVWCGDHDQNTPLAMSKYIAAKLPGAKMIVMEGLTHYTIFAEENMERILRDFVATAQE